MTDKDHDHKDHQPEAAEGEASEELSEHTPEAASGEGGTPLGSSDEHSETPGPHGTE